MRRPRPERSWICTNYLPADRLFFSASAEEYRHAISATAVTLSNGIVRRSGLLVIQIKPYKPTALIHEARRIRRKRSGAAGIWPDRGCGETRAGSKMMETDRWEQIERLYHAALERGPDARETFLDEACAGDEDLRREVAGLLACDVPSDSFIRSPAIDIVAKALADEPLIEASTKPMWNLNAGSQIGAYQLLEPLGRGGMGEVHLALDTRLGRKVAVKLLPAEFTTDDGRVRRFTQEARAASALNHPNIITIHEIGETATENGSLRYIVTEYVEGETLRRRIANAPQQRIEPPEAIDIALQIAAALSAAHQAGITHRDIKPENVMARRDGIVKVLDFGLAKLTEPAAPSIDTQAPTLQRVTSTESGVVMGTPRYMSPEQARGEKLDARTD